MRTIWLTLDRQRFFAIPPDVELPPGDLEIRSAQGERRSVDAESAEAFEIDRERANGLLAAHLEEGWRRLKEGIPLTGLLGGTAGEVSSRIQEKVEGLLGGDAPSPALDDETARRFREAVDGFRAKVTEAMNDPNVKRTLNELGRDLGDLVKTLKDETSKLDRELRRSTPADDDDASG
jgi:hypothetical protein